MKTISILIGIATLAVVPPAFGQQPAPHHVHLVAYSGADCHTGPHEASFDPGSPVELKACVFSADELPADTSTDPTVLSWSIRGSATFESEPPSETDDAGEAVVTILPEGDSEITVALCTADPCEPDAILDTSSVVLRSVHGDPACAFNGTGCNGAVIDQQGQRKLFVAVGQWPEPCMTWRPLVIKKRKDGPDRIMRIVQADGAGEATTSIPRWWHGRHYVVAPRWQVEYDDSMITCSRLRSKSIFIR